MITRTFRTLKNISTNKYTVYEKKGIFFTRWELFVFWTTNKNSTMERTFIEADSRREALELIRRKMGDSVSWQIDDGMRFIC